MVGQKLVINEINNFISRDALPRFILIIGSKDSGRRTLAKYIAKQLNCNCLIFGNKVEDARQMIEFAYAQVDPCIYCIPNYEEMSAATTNALLKVAEEPPQQAYIIITGNNKSDILPTLLSRGTTFELEDYTESDLEQFAKDNSINPKLLEVCTSPGELIRHQDVDAEAFSKLVDSVWNNVGKATRGNTLKLSSYIKIKDTDSGYDFNLFINAITHKIIESISEIKDAKACEKLLQVLYTSHRIKRMYASKFYKQSLVDEYLLCLRENLNGII